MWSNFTTCDATSWTKMCNWILSIVYTKMLGLWPSKFKIFIGSKCKGWLVLSSNPIKWHWMKTCWNPTWIIANNIGWALGVFFRCPMKISKDKGPKKSPQITMCYILNTIIKRNYLFSFHHFWKIKLKEISGGFPHKTTTPLNPKKIIIIIFFL